MSAPYFRLDDGDSASACGEASWGPMGCTAAFVRFPLVRAICGIGSALASVARVGWRRARCADRSPDETSEPVLDDLADSYYTPFCPAEPSPPWGGAVIPPGAWIRVPAVQKPAEAAALPPPPVPRAVLSPETVSESLIDTLQGCTMELLGALDAAPTIECSVQRGSYEQVASEHLGSTPERFFDSVFGRAPDLGDVRAECGRIRQTFLGLIASAQASVAGGMPPDEALGEAIRAARMRAAPVRTAEPIAPRARTASQTAMALSASPANLAPRTLPLRTPNN